MTTQHIKKLWREVANEYRKKFCEALEIDIIDAYWVGDDPGTTAVVGDYFVDIHDMRYLVDNIIDTKLYIKWYDYSLDIHELQERYNEIEHFTTLRNISFESFVNGAPCPYSQEDIVRMRGYLDAIREATEKFKKEYESLSKR